MQIVRVSVIVPAYNAAADVAETLSSVSTQTYDGWEVVIADDASTDATVEVVRTFGERFKLVSNPRNSGPADARNLAIAHSSGELLAFLDADDLWLPEYLDSQVRLYDKAQASGSRVGIVACNARLLGNDGLLPSTYEDHYGHAAGLTLPRLLRSNPIFVSALVPRAVVDEAGGFCSEIFGAEDYDLWVRILERGYHVVGTSSPLAVYRLRPNSVSTRVGSMAQARQRVYRRALDRGNLSSRERRIARRELRLQRAIEQIAMAKGASSTRTLKALSLLTLAAAEHPKRWPSYARTLLRNDGRPPFPR